MEQINQQKGAHHELRTVTEPEELRNGLQEMQPQSVLGHLAVTDQEMLDPATEADAGQPREDLDPYDQDEDPFSWIDAAEWHPWQDVDDSDPENLDVALDEALGDWVTTGWYGLRRHVDRPGGVVVSQNPCGARGLWSTDSDADLAEEWANIQREHQAFVLATRTTDTEAGAESPRPEVLIGTLRTSQTDHFHGAWLDASVGAEELDNAIQLILRNSCDASTEEWAVFGHRGFPEQLGEVLDECQDAETICKVTHGIQEHGPAFAAWAAYVHLDDHEALDRFSQQYQGEYESLEAYAVQALQDAGDHRRMEKASYAQRPSPVFDVEAHARDLVSRLHVVEAPNGHVWIFDTQY